MTNNDFRTLFKKTPALIGMVHLPALPGSPNFKGNLTDVLKSAQADAQTLEAAGFSALMIENLGDFPYFPDHVPNETVAAMAIVADRIKSRTNLPVGMNVLRNDGRAALAIAAAAELSFIRVNVLAGVAVTDQGLIQGQAHWLLRDRRRLSAEHVAIFADIHVKHAAPLAPRDLGQEIEEHFERAGCTALIVSGTGSGKPVDAGFLRNVKLLAADRPVLIGSGLNAENAAQLFAIADGAIVGTAIKLDGKIHNPIDRRRAEELVGICRRQV